MDAVSKDLKFVNQPHQGYLAAKYKLYPPIKPKLTVTIWARKATGTFITDIVQEAAKSRVKCIFLLFNLQVGV